VRRINALGARFASVKSRLTATSLSRLAGTSLAKQAPEPYHRRFDTDHRLNLAICRIFEQEFNPFLLSPSSGGVRRQSVFRANLCAGKIRSDSSIQAQGAGEFMGQNWRGYGLSDTRKAFPF
jgi:hypothetical protein